MEISADIGIPSCCLLGIVALCRFQYGMSEPPSTICMRFLERRQYCMFVWHKFE